MVFELLQIWKKQNDDDGAFVFGNEALNPRTAYEIIRQSGLRAGLLQPLHPHALRHSFATHLLSSGANLRTLQELLGHESLQATEKYTHLGIDQLARTMENIHPLGSKLKTGS
ncbi:Tyrosine recombinase XerD [compost metagenome]